jgi:hypothetical protein
MAWLCYATARYVCYSFKQEIDMTQIEKLWFKKVLRLNNCGPRGRKGILVYLENDKKPTLVHQNYPLSRGLGKRGHQGS